MSIAKSLLLRVLFNGDGIVNFDSPDQKYLWNKLEGAGFIRHNNTMVGKARYESKKVTRQNQDKEDYEKEVYTRVPINSADCIRHTMYEDVMRTHLPNVQHDDDWLIRTIANPAFIQRGYMFPRANKESWKRKSSLAFGYAKGITPSVPAIETFSNSQERDNVEKSESGSETSFFSREVRGQVNYEMTGVIDLAELGFISLSDVHDRLGFHPDLDGEFIEMFKKHFKFEDTITSGYFVREGDAYEIPEQGILLGDKYVIAMVEDILKRLARFNLVRTTTGFLQTAKVEVMVVKDPLTDRVTNTDGWINVFDNGKFSVDFLKGLKIERVYNETSIEEAIEKVRHYKELKNVDEPVVEAKPPKKPRGKKEAAA